MLKKTIKGICAAVAAVMLMQNAVFAHNLVKDSGFEIHTYADGVTVAKPVYTVDGTVIDTLGGQAGKTVTVTAPAVRNTKTARSLNMVTALFDANDTYINSNITKSTITALDGSDKLVNTLALGEDVTSEYKLKTFIWSDVSDLMPYTEAFELASAAVNTAWTLGENWSIDLRDTPVNDSSKYGFGALRSRGGSEDCASQTISVKNGQAYLLSFYVNGQNNSSMEVQLVSNGVTLKDEVLDLSYGYARKNLPFVADSDSVELKFINKSSSNLYIDCVSLDENLISNGDFENGHIEGWPTNNADGDNLSKTLDNTTVHSGTASLRIDGRSSINSSVMQWLTDVIKVTGPGTYELGGWIKTENGGNPRFEISKSVTGQDTVSSTQIASPASEWVYDIATMTFTQADIDSLNNVKINFWAGGSNLADGTKGAMWIDDMYLINRGNNLYMNGGFEYGETMRNNGKKWSCSNNNSAFKVYADTSEKHSGVASACIYGRNSATEHARMSINDIIEKNGAGTYRLSAWVKGNGGWTFMDCKVLDAVNEIANHSGSNSAEWHEITYDIVIPEGTDLSGMNSSNAYIDIWCGTPKNAAGENEWQSGDAGKVWFDDISIVKVADTAVSE